MIHYTTWTEDKLEELVDLWNEELGESFPMRKELFLQNSFKDKNICAESSRIALDNENKVVGFIVSKRWQYEDDVGISKDTGWIQVLLVSRKHRNIGIGTALLEHAESTLRENGMKQILLGKDTYHYFPGIPTQYKEAVKWFEDKGYENFGTEVDLVNHYESATEIENPKTENAEFSVLELKDKEGFLDFMHRCFPGRWEYEAIEYFKNGGTGREFVVLKKQGKIIGFSRINDASSPVIAQNVYWAPMFDTELGGVGPLGIDSNERKQGYGIAIVEAAIAYLRKRDIKKVVIDWTGLIGFYNKLGYEVWKEYYSFKKEL